MKGQDYSDNGSWANRLSWRLYVCRSKIIFPLTCFSLIRSLLFEK